MRIDPAAPIHRALFLPVIASEAKQFDPGQSSGSTRAMRPWLRRLARLIVVLAIAAVLVVLFAGSEVVPAFVLYLALALFCLPAALVLHRRRRRSDAPRMGLRPRD